MRSSALMHWHLNPGTSHASLPNLRRLLGVLYLLGAWSYARLLNESLSLWCRELPVRLLLSVLSVLRRIHVCDQVKSLFDVVLRLCNTREAFIPLPHKSMSIVNMTTDVMPRRQTMPWSHILSAACSIRSLRDSPSCQVRSQVLRGE